MKVIERLYELQELELSATAGSPEVKRTIESIRKQTPEPIMGHYDRLMARGKKAVALVQHGVCTGCRMRLPSGAYATLLRDNDICMCDNCGRYLLLAPDEQVLPAKAAAPAQTTKPQPAKPEKKPRKTQAQTRKRTKRATNRKLTTKVKE